MNNLPSEVYKPNRLYSFVPWHKSAKQKNPIEIRQLFLVIRIMVSIFTVGLLGYTLDRFMHSIQQRFSF